MTEVRAFPFQCPYPLRSQAQARTTAHHVGRGRGASACPWFEVDSGESEEGGRQAGRVWDCLLGFPWNPQGLLRGHPEARDLQRGASRWREGLYPALSERGLLPCAQFRGCRGAGRGASAKPASELAGPGERTNPQALEDVIPLGPGNSSSAPLPSTPPRPRLSLFGDFVPLPTREVVTAVTLLPALARAGAPRSPASRPRPVAAR